MLEILGNKSTLVVDILQSAILHSVPLYAIQSLKMIVSTLEIISHHALSYAWQIVSRFTILGLDPEKKSQNLTEHVFQANAYPPTKFGATST